MSVEGAERIERMLESLAELSGSYDVEITPGNTTRGGASNADKLGYLIGQGRNFILPTDAMEAAVVEKLEGTVQALLDEDLPVMPGAMEEIGNGVLAHTVKRFKETTANGPPDVPMPPLSDAWIEHKENANIGVYTGALSQGMARGDVTTRKR